MLEPGIHPIPPETLVAMATADPGSYYQIGNEPNILSGSNTPQGYAEALHYYATHIKGADPTAILVGPNVLNFDFTCVGCVGYMSGHAWIDAMRAAYSDLYGTEPPLDIWGIHFYPLDWTVFPSVRDDIIREDFLDFWAYRDTIPGLSDHPIWITEIGLHWGFAWMEWTNADGTPCSGGPCYFAPGGEYQTDAVAAYLRRLFDFFESVSEESGLERWFLYRHHFSFGPNASATNGLTLFEEDAVGAPLSDIGEVYRELIFD